MKFVSTRGAHDEFSIRAAIQNGLALDGGLYVPKVFPKFTTEDFKNTKSVAEVAEVLLAPFFKDDTALFSGLKKICESTFEFQIPLSKVPGKPGDFILELFHGPTSAFKDVGARFLANVMEVIIRDEPKTNERKTVLVATSGDTGGAVAGAFFGKPNLEVAILFPDGKISPRQEKQLCAWGGNIQAFAVDGTFDDCQRIVKEALSESKNVAKTHGREWLSANSINLGRILPQMVYYAHTALQLKSASFVIPSGNLGNSMAAVWAKKMGLPIQNIHLALNANHGVVEFVNTGTFSFKPTIPTLANAMDVSRPSNLERMTNLYPSVDELRTFLHAESVNDEEIKKEIQASEKKWGQVFCPHTAVAGVVRERNFAKFPSIVSSPWVIVATAHPAKFETIVEPLIGHKLSVPPSLAEILKKPSRVKKIEATYSAFMAAIASS